MVFQKNLSYPVCFLAIAQNAFICKCMYHHHHIFPINISIHENIHILRTHEGSPLVHNCGLDLSLHLPIFHSFLKDGSNFHLFEYIL